MNALPFIAVILLFEVLNHYIVVTATNGIEPNNKILSIDSFQLKGDSITGNAPVVQKKDLLVAEDPGNNTVLNVSVLNLNEICRFIFWYINSEFFTCCELFFCRFFR